jgi:hypothetical protein
VSPYAAPARRDDLSGLPPTWIGVGTADLFHDECVDYANRLRAPQGCRRNSMLFPADFTDSTLSVHTLQSCGTSSLISWALCVDC